MRQALCSEPSYIFTLSLAPWDMYQYSHFTGVQAGVQKGSSLTVVTGLVSGPTRICTLSVWLLNTTLLVISGCCFSDSGLFAAENICRLGGPKYLLTEWRGRTNSFTLLILCQAMIWALYEHTHINNSKRQVLTSPFLQMDKGGVERNLSKVLRLGWWAWDVIVGGLTGPESVILNMTHIPTPERASAHPKSGREAFTLKV